MLTKKQAELFKLLDISETEENEKALRQHYKMVRQFGRVKKPFTGWLEDCLRAKWRRENKRVYVGD